MYILYAVTECLEKSDPSEAAKKQNYITIAD
jgi:hypothetical protein